MLKRKKVSTVVPMHAGISPIQEKQAYVINITQGLGSPKTLCMIDIINSFINQRKEESRTPLLSLNLESSVKKLDTLLQRVTEGKVPQ